MWSALGNEPLNATAQWHSDDSSQRGTYSILSTCIATLTLCVWTALHMNIPERGRSGTQTWKKIGWMLAAIAGPEMIVFTAFQQRRAASRLHAAMTRCLNPLTSSVSPADLGLYSRLIAVHRGRQDDEKRAPQRATSSRQYAWSRTHSAYAVMGGFAFDNTHDPLKVPFPDSRTSLTLTPKGLIFLAEHYPELVPDIPEEAIQDKSKADGLAKAITCGQALWFLAQTITRLAFGLAITVLELNTIAHCICALSMYLFWWYKPFNVNEPTTIPTSTSLVAEVSAAMCMRSRIGYWRTRPESRGFARAVAGALEFDFDITAPQNPAGDPTSVADNSPPGTSADETTQAATDETMGAALTESSEGVTKKQAGTLASDVPREGVILAYGDVVHGVGLRYTANIPWAGASPGLSAYKSDIAIHVPPELLQLSNLARDTVLAFEELRRPRVQEYEDYAPTLINWRGQDLVQARMEDFPRLSIFVGRPWDVLVGIVGCIFVNMLYGGFHMLAWNGPFHTKAEEILWRMSALSLCAPGVIAFFGFFIGVPVIFAASQTSPLGSSLTFQGITRRDLMDSIDSAFRTMESDAFVRSWRYAAFLGLVFLVAPISLGLFGGMLFSLAIGRVFVVVECFLSLPYAPASVFLTPQWPTYWPHIG